MNITPVCAGRPRDGRAGLPPVLPAVTVLAVKGKAASPSAPPASVTVVLAVPLGMAPQAARALQGCSAALSPAS